MRILKFYCNEEIGRYGQFLVKNPIDNLVHELAKLPSVGDRTALRLALHILRQPPEYGQRLANSLTETLQKVRFCKSCFNLSTEETCHVCLQPNRDSTTLCVVEDIADLQAIEKSHSYKGMYHVLHGALSPIDGIGPDDLRIDDLIKRIETKNEINEIILATNPNVNGDATALYLSKRLSPYNVKITRLASGIPVGGHIEFIDQNTLSKAMESRLLF